MITILGAGGAISDQLVKLLGERKQPFRLVGRNPRMVTGAAEIRPADLSDPSQTVAAVKGSNLVYLLVGLKYDHRIWAETWPRIMANTIEASKRAGAKLVFFDNVYMYGQVKGAMTEETPFHPSSKKGEIRARIAQSLANEWKSGSVTAMIARAADFYGPEARNSVPNLLVFDPLSKNQKASWLVNDAVAHSYTYTPDAARGVVMLAETESAWNQTWHLPTAPNPLTGKEFITHAARELGVRPRYRVLNRPMLKIAGWFNPTIGESYEMLYQSDSPYIFDSSKFAGAFRFSGTDYAEGIRQTAASFSKTTPSV